LGHLLGNDLAAEHPREGVADHAFEPSLEAFYDAHNEPPRDDLRHRS
jgi:hypothetical protein